MKRTVSLIILLVMSFSIVWAEEPSRNGGLLDIFGLNKNGDSKNRSYKIGETGPGGGKIFYVSKKGFNVYEADGTSKKCHYLEASDVISKGISWCSLDKNKFVDLKGFCCGNISPKTEIGYGKANTAVIIKTNHFHGNIDSTNCAAVLCSEYSTPTTSASEWWLPSKDELNLIYVNLVAKGIIAQEGYYWSSSTYSGGEEWGHLHAWGHGFGSGSQDHGDKVDPLSVIAVRAF